MPPVIFAQFLATNWCSLVDSEGCRWGKFSALWRSWVARVNTPPDCVSVFISVPISGLLGISG